jgi:hypothetical protein
MFFKYDKLYCIIVQSIEVYKLFKLLHYQLNEIKYKFLYLYQLMVLSRWTCCVNLYLRLDIYKFKKTDSNPLLQRGFFLSSKCTI